MITNFEKYKEILDLDYFEILKDGTIYRKERIWNNNGGIQKQPKKLCVPSIDGSGYSCISCCINRKKYFLKVHLLIKIYFDGFPIDVKMQVDHIDGNKQNNSLDNLEWVTPNVNMKRAFELGLNKVSDSQRESRRKRMIENNPMKNPEIAKKSAEFKVGRPLSEEHKLAISKGFKNNKLNKNND